MDFQKKIESLYEQLKILIWGCLIAISLPVLYYIEQGLGYDKSNFQTVIGTLRDTPKGEGTPFQFRLNEYDDHFVAGGYADYIVRYELAIENLEKGDTVFVSILKPSLRGFESRLNNALGIIRPMELWTRDSVYISLEDYNEYRRNDYI